MLGYTGKILRIDLSTGKTTIEKLDEETAKKYVGGIGLGMKLWLANSKPGVDPFNPENPLVLAVGPASATMFPTGGNGHAFISRSPETGFVGEAVSHGTFGAEIKRAGYDAIILTGKAERPVYLWIDDDAVQLLDADKLWGKSPSETEDAIKDEIGDYYVRVASIGLAGEKQSKIASIVNEKTRVAGRTGLGAVMGSKNLKSIAVRGTHDIVVAKPEEFIEYVKEFHERMKGPAAQKYRTLGSAENVMIQNALYCMPTRNYNNSYFDNAQKVSGETLNERYIAKIIACNSCAMRCEHEAVIRDGPYKGTMARMEYDNIWALGPNCGVDKLDAIVKAAELCNYYGLDAQSTGVTVSFVMDCHEKGILSHEELGGVDAHFGNPEALLQLIEKIGKREGIGDVLADGVKAAAQKIGKGSDKLAENIKGLEVTGYDLRCLKTTALGFAVSFRGADHNRSGAYTFDMTGKVDRFKAEKGRGKLVKDSEDVYALIDSLIICKNAKGTLYNELPDMAKLYTLITGYEMTPQELGITGERINTLARLINIREGLSRKDDTLPWKVMNQPVTDDGPAKGAVVTQGELDLLLDDYYTARGWTLEGVPTKELLAKLGLEDLSSIIEGKED
ncbi:MAG TPA: aldehyde ferredoxin oxidoreductase family protein [Candidatus Limnocylindrales bacterium]|nr:aldehyde ferredoxin oxidoreductase family protein [Candidatus Limnocylindrales bacterium]